MLCIAVRDAIAIRSSCVVLVTSVVWFADGMMTCAIMCAQTS